MTFKTELVLMMTTMMMMMMIIIITRRPLGVNSGGYIHEWRIWTAHQNDVSESDFIALSA